MGSSLGTLSDQLCACGCGEFTTLMRKTDSARGRVKGQPNLFVYSHGRGWKHPNPTSRVSEEHRREVARLASQRNWRKNREAFNAARRAARAANPEPYRAASREAHWRHRPERLRAARAAWDPEKGRVVSKAWREANPERARELKHRSELNRRARKRGAFRESIDPLMVLERDDGECGICGGDVDPMHFHVDHVFPLALGGEHSYANVQAAHPACNSSKGWSA